MTDLLPEFEAAQPDARTIDWLRRAGVPDHVLHGPRSHVGVGRIDTTDFFWDPQADGMPAIIVPCGEPGLGFGWCSIDDLVAFGPTNIRQWWMRRREVVVLGECNLDLARSAKAKINLVETPFHYLVYNPEESVACVVDWARVDPDMAFDGLTIVCQTTRLAHRLERRRQQLRRPRYTIEVCHGRRLQAA